MSEPTGNYGLPPAADGGSWGVGRAGGGTARGTTLLALAMLGWMFLMMALAAIGGTAGAAAREPVSLGRGVVVTPANGWSPAANVWEGVPAQTAFKRAGAVAAFSADAYDGDARTLLDEQLADIEGQFSSFRSLPPASLETDGGLQAMRVLFEGVSGAAELEGQLAVVSRNGTGVVMLAFAPRGQLRRAQSDLDAMLQNLVVP